jgi:hypothetical protein
MSEDMCTDIGMLETGVGMAGCLTHVAGKSVFARNWNIPSAIE